MSPSRLCSGLDGCSSSGVTLEALPTLLPCYCHAAAAAHVPTMLLMLLLPPPVLMILDCGLWAWCETGTGEKGGGGW